MDVLKTYRLKAPDALHPLWLQRFGGCVQKAIVEPNGAIVVAGVQLEFARGVVPLEAGTAVEVWLDSYFLCAVAGDRELHAQARQLAREAADAEKTSALEQQRQADQAFNASLAVPVAWTIGVKDVLSGLSERSDGSGRNRATVNHILLQAELQSGRLSRAAGDLLCTSATGTNGKNWSAQRAERAGRVTCARCLALTKPWHAIPSGAVKNNP